MRLGAIRVSDHNPKTLSDLKFPIALFIAGVWGIAFTIGAITQSIILLTATTPMFTIVVYAIFSFKNGNGKNGGKKHE